MKRYSLSLSALALGGLLTMTAPAISAPKVVTSIKPVHSLVLGVMQGVGEPTLLIKSGGSPHSYSLRPSEARALQEADLVFWVGERIETFLEKPLDTLAEGARVITLSDAEGVALLEYREDEGWEAHDHSDHAETEHGDDGHAEAEHGDHNMHVWLDPHNAEAIVRAAVAALQKADAANGARYAENGKAVIARIAAMDADIQARLAPVKDVPYLVFHDAYQYFEAHYGTRAVGSITLSPERAPGAKRIAALRDRIVDSGAACVFSEPQFEPALVATLVEGTVAKTSVLDPLGVDLPAGPEAYFLLMESLADSLVTCLKPTT